MKKGYPKQGCGIEKKRLASAGITQKDIRDKANRGRKHLSKLYAEHLDREGRRTRAVYNFLRITYKGVRKWMDDGVEDRVEEELRNRVDGATHKKTSIFLVLLRAALPDAEQKMLSGWAAALECAHAKDIPEEHFVGFVMAIGGIEGAKKMKSAKRQQHRRIRRP